MIGWLFVGLLGIAGAAYVVTPLWRGPRRDLPTRDPLEAEATRRKQDALAAIIDLERDLESGKLDEHDFEVLRAEQEGHALRALKEIDALAGAGRSDEELEAEIAEARARLECPSCGAIRTRKTRCPRCGAP